MLAMRLSAASPEPIPSLGFMPILAYLPFSEALHARESGTDSVLFRNQSTSRSAPATPHPKSCTLHHGQPLNPERQPLKHCLESLNCRAG
jgi:hypothetical protein